MDPLRVIHSDRDLACVEKPSGLLSVRGKGEAGRDCVVGRLSEQFGWAREAHRLDMDTSGLMVVALNAESHRHLCAQFRHRVVAKRYEAMVKGHPKRDGGAIDLRIRADIANRPRQVVDHEHGKEALTRYEVRERLSGDRARLELTPTTGRSHQLRLHLAAVGHPILGDDLYAPPEVLALSDRLLLHATFLALRHPRSGEQIEFVSSCPF